MTRPRPRYIVIASALCVLILGLTGVAGASVPPLPTTDTYVETRADNPITAEPPISRPSTPHCTETLAQDFYSNGPNNARQYFSGTLTPPAGCPGPWSKVVLDYNVTVSGYQYDRIGYVLIGGAEVYWGTTQEPTGNTPITYTVSKDITDYTALLKQPQAFAGGIGNVVNATYTGNYKQTVTITYYTADVLHPAPREPSFVEGFPYHLIYPGATSANFTLSGLPRNITSAYVNTVLEGSGCDETWFFDVPADETTNFGACPGGPYREALVSIDGQVAGATHTYPHIYSGGVIPQLWRPIPGIDAYDLRPESINITPFVGQLVDGGTHTLTLTMANAGATWQAIPTLFAYTDPHLTQTTGALLSDNAATSPTLNTLESSTATGNEVTVTASRNDVTSGYVNTSAGRVYSTVTRTMSFSNVHDVSPITGGHQHDIQQSDAGSETVQTSIGQLPITTATRHSYDYPLHEAYAGAGNSAGYTLNATVGMGQKLSDARQIAGVWLPALQSSEEVDSTAVFGVQNGVTTAADGQAETTYAGLTDMGLPYWHKVTSDHALVTSDVTWP